MKKTLGKFYLKNFHKHLAFIVSILVFVFIINCSKDSANPAGQDNSDTYTITGMVYQNSAGLYGATVRLVGTNKDTTATTGSDGSYTFTGIPDGVYTITPSKTDILFTQQSIQVTVNGENVTISEFSGINDPHLSFVSIPGGTFQMGNVENVSGGHAIENEMPVHTVTLTGFEMSAYEITNAQYAEYLNTAQPTGDIEISTDGDVYGISGSGSGQRYIDIGYMGFNSDNQCRITSSNGIFSVTVGYEYWPVVAVTWYGAKAYALYYCCDLSTESEWEYACRGGAQYNYGTNDGMIDPAKANVMRNIGYPVDVGSYPANPYGLYDMSGNVLEWCNDWYDETYPSENVTNPTGAQSGLNRVIRSSDFNSSESWSRSAMRYFATPDNRSSEIGFRVVRRAGGLAY